MTQYDPYLRWIETQQEAMLRHLIDWAAINSGSGNVAGLKRMAGAIYPLLADLSGETRQLDLPPGKSIDSRGEVRELPLGPSLHAVKTQAGAALRVFLGIHFDTVYDADHPFQSVKEIDDNTLNGPGVVDAKGGLVVLLTALRALQRSPWANALTWEVLLNSDEEIGSPGSRKILEECARRNDLGLVFEPALPDGGLVSARKGSANVVVVVRGKSAHVGRDFSVGRNAIHALASFIVDAAAIPDALPGIVLNIGKIEGGGPVNVVPELAICRLNLRATTHAEMTEGHARLESLVEKMGRRDGIRAVLHRLTDAPPKPLDDTTQAMLDAAAGCARDLGIGRIGFQSSGGVSDGNRLAAAGLPTLDTLGVRGGNLHSPDEFVRIDSLVERAKLTALLLMKIGSGELKFARRGAPK